VLFPNALVFDARLKVDDYVASAGGFTQGADRAKVLVLRQNGTVVEAAGAELRPGDEIMAMPKIETKNVELTRGISQIVYQIAVAAKVLFGL
jgi:protein involved in polysaccharide export with SLBB domain